jgi:hypothetical protein
MPTTRTFTVRTPDDLLALAPWVLGFHPEDSLVLMTVGGPEDRFHARVDLPADDVAIADLSELLAGAARRNGVDRVVLVVYGDDHCLAQRTTECLTTALAPDVTVLEAIRADGERWYALTDCTEACCPAEGRPYDVTAHPLTAQSVLEGRVTMRSRAELADSLVGTDPEAVESVLDAAEEASGRLLRAVPAQPDSASASSRSLLVAEGRWVQRLLEGYLDGHAPPGHAEAGRLLVALASIEIRDVAWAAMDRENATVFVELWRDLVRRCPHELLPAPAALLGFAAWLAGDGALAWCALERCQEVEPDYRLAALLSEALSGAVPPSTWRPVPPEELTLFAG